MMPYVIDFSLALPKIRCTTHKQALAKLVDEVSAYVRCDTSQMLDCLLENEMLSSSASGGGVAIPHMKVTGLSKRFVALATLDKPVDFEAIDGQDVDIVCLLLSPESDGPIHLRGLSRITRMLKNEILCENLRGTDDADIMRSLLINPDGWLIAA